jgi:hypothetical protein
VTKRTIDYIKEEGAEPGLTYFAYQIIFVNVMQHILFRLFSLHDQTTVSMILHKAKCVMDTIIYDKINTVSIPASAEHVTEGRIMGLTTKDTVYIRRLLNEITLCVWTIVNIIGVFSFFISNFGYTFIVILVVVFAVRKLEDRIDQIKRDEINL